MGPPAVALHRLTPKKGGRDRELEVGSLAHYDDPDTPLEETVTAFAAPASEEAMTDSEIALTTTIAPPNRAKAALWAASRL